jgi:hypothetical protein
MKEKLRSSRKPKREEEGVSTRSDASGNENGSEVDTRTKKPRDTSTSGDTAEKASLAPSMDVRSTTPSDSKSEGKEAERRKRSSRSKGNEGLQTTSQEKSSPTTKTMVTTDASEPKGRSSRARPSTDSSAGSAHQGKRTEKDRDKDGKQKRQSSRSESEDKKASPSRSKDASSSKGDSQASSADTASRALSRDTRLPKTKPEWMGDKEWKLVSGAMKAGSLWELGTALSGLGECGARLGTLHLAI